MRRIRALLRNDKGTTIVELSVTMLILGIIVAATATLAIGFSRTNAQNTNRQDQIEDARQAVERISKTLRTAVKPSQLIAACSVACGDIDAFMQGKDASVQFYANLNNPGNRVGPSRITYTVGTTGASAGLLVETAQTPTDSNPSTPVVDPGHDGYVYCDATNPLASEECKSHLTSRVLAHDVQTSSPVFKYYGPDGARLSTSTTGLTSDELSQVLAIELVVTIQKSRTTEQVSPTTYIQRITLPNAQAVLQQGRDDDD